MFMTLRDIVMSDMPFSVREAALNELLQEERLTAKDGAGILLNCPMSQLGIYKIPQFIYDTIDELNTAGQKLQALKLLRSFAFATQQESSLRIAKETVESISSTAIAKS